ncbi:MAG: hypothetical protein MRK02_02285 [Candidatus Scalindua sp.]|nr:hypothetical protein [Candidatus Scalindua sp.]
MSKSIKRRDVLLSAVAVVGGGFGLSEFTSRPEKKNSAKAVLTHHSNDDIKEPEKVPEKTETVKPSDDIGNGEQGFSRDEKSWEVIVKRFYKLYMPIRIDGKDEPDPSLFLKGPLDPNLLSLDTNLTFKSQEPDKNLRSFQVETLLSQAADLLRRAKILRSEWQDKANKAVNLRLEILEYLINDTIHQDEIKAGIYTLPYKRSVSEVNALTARKEGLQYVSSVIKSTLDNNFTLDAMNKHSGNSQLLALLPYYPSHETPYLKKAVNLTWNYTPNNFAEHAKKAAFDQSFYHMHNKKYALYTQKYMRDMDRDVVKQRYEGSHEQMEWARKEIEFRRRRAQAAREVGDLKIRLATEPGGVLNYAEQMDKIRLQYERDLREALAGIKAAYEGLQLIYGYNKALPVSIASQVKLENQDKKGQQTPCSVLDDSVVWVSDTLAWLGNNSMIDQKYTMSISVRQTIGDKKWYEGRKSGQWKFEIPESFFPDQKYVRLRGISVYVSGIRAKGVWMARVDLPKKSFCHHSFGRVADLDQTSIPPILIGRISKRNRTFQQEIAGASIVHNASPFGEWRVFLNEKSTAGNVLDSVDEIELVDDLELDLEIAARS